MAGEPGNSLLKTFAVTRQGLPRSEEAESFGCGLAFAAVLAGEHGVGGGEGATMSSVCSVCIALRRWRMSWNWLRVWTRNAGLNQAPFGAGGHPCQLWRIPPGCGGFRHGGQRVE